MARAAARGLPLALVVFGGLAVLLSVRLLERPVCGARRPLTPSITCMVCRAALAIIGIDHRIEGAPMPSPGAVVANHVSWLDIFALNARQRVVFVAKAEVADWPGIGWLARATGSVFVRRDRREAAGQKRLLADRLALGQRLLFFPEGTSTDGRRVLPFRPTLFAALLGDDLPDGARLQPVSLVYRAPEGCDPAFYGWWDDMAFGAHLLAVLAAPRQGEVCVRYHPPVALSGGRKALARAAEDVVRRGLETRLTFDGEGAGRRPRPDRAAG